MATLVANGNASVLSPAYQTDDGEFMHVDQVVAQRNARVTPIKYGTSFAGRSKTTSHIRNNMGTAHKKIYGDSTVWVDGEAYPNATWAKLRVHPMEDPDNKGEWIHPDRYNSVMAYRQAKKEASANASSKTSGAINKATGIPGAVGKAAMNSEWGKAASSAMSEYDRKHKVAGYDKNGNYGWQNTGNAAGRALAGARGAVGQEARNIYEGAIEARNQYRINNYNAGKKGNFAGEALATAKGAIGSSAVGRAGRVAFEALKQKAINAKDAFTKAINKYLTGDGAGANRKQALQDLQTKAGSMMAAVRQAFGTGEGRAKMLGNITGTASGLAAGIAQSNIGKAAISAGKSAFGAVKDKVGSALSAIGDFFKKKSNVNASNSSNNHLKKAQA